MWVLITKLRSANTVETQQYHKAAKALLVLMPLLGITYVITIYAPTPDKKSEIIFECIRAVLLSTQKRYSVDKLSVEVSDPGGKISYCWQEIQSDQKESKSYVNKRSMHGCRQFLVSNATLQGVAKLTYSKSGVL
ncbi:hypothetical protein GEV33_000953 [Tenebrio molitor]|uniref:Uncharacterized protein n=1 Tax=Tenebrio molitor TaxID=7067 RepID=A0A8J6HYM3_TENMO|nr:hypothetical protein GEV33_000953 [Tenebrio molitor]